MSSKQPDNLTALESTSYLCDRRTTLWLETFIISSIIVIALLIRFIGLANERLWTDEVYSATFAVQPLTTLLIADLRFDLHPPLYYLQLKFWALLGHSTFWLYVNSLVWSLLSVAALLRCTKQFLSPITAIVAVGIFSLMPIGVEWAHSLRMYGFIGFLSIFTWFFCYRFFTRPDFGRNGMMLVACMLAITYSHASGVLILGYVGVYGVYLIKQNRPDSVRVWWFLRLYLVTAVLAVPAVVNVLLRNTDHLELPTPIRVAGTLAHLLAGPAATQVPWACVLAMLAAVFIIAGLLADAKIRAMLVGFVLTPIAFAIIVSYVRHPMWADRTLFFTTPFLAIAVAQGIFVIGHAIGTRAGRLAERAAIFTSLGILAAGLGAASIWAAQDDWKPTNYRAAAHEISARLQPGDVILVPERAAFWGLAWSLIGPDWGSPLAVQDESPGNDSDTWTKILEWLGPVWRKRLSLEPRTRIVSYNGAVMVVGYTLSPVIVDAKRVWLVNVANNRRPYLELTDFVEIDRQEYRALTVQLLRREATP